VKTNVNFSTARAVALFLATTAITSAVAAGPTTIAFTSAPRTAAVATCSNAVRLQTQDASGSPAAVPTRTTIYPVGSSPSLKFFSDSGCLHAETSFAIAQGNYSTKFFFEGSAAGTELIAISTSSYGGAQQYETVTTISTPPPPAPTGTTAAGRPIPLPVYGVTLDDVAGVNAEVTSLLQLNHFPTARVVFDYSEPASYYSGPINQLRSAAYIMGQLADSSDMAKYTAASMQTRAQSYVSTLAGLVDVWEVGNEVNGNWLGSNTLAKIEAAYDVVSAAGGSTAITFFYEGEPSDPNNCISTQNGGNDMFTWITNNFQLNLPADQRSAETEKIRLGTNHILVSWYPQQCNNLQPAWNTIFTRLSSIFPNSRTGFGEIGTANPQGGSTYEINLINQFYPLAKTTALPASFEGGYFWWYYAEEMVPTTATGLFPVLNSAIQ